YGELIYPKSGDVVASHFRLIIDTNLPDTEDPNERFQTRLFAHYQDALPRVPAMNDLSWLPGGVRLQDFVGPQSLDLYGPGMESTFYLPGTLIMRGWTGHREMPIDTAARRGDNAAIEQARTAIASLLHQYAKHVTVNGEECLFWEKPLEGAWRPEWGGAPVRTLHNTDAWYAARVLVELYRYDRAHGHDNPEYLQAIDGIFNWAKHFVWTRNEFPDVPSSPFAIGGTLSIAFLLDYYFTFKDDAQRGTNAQLALKLADHITWRYLPVWAMDSDRADGLLDSSFLLEPNSGRDWAGLACANEMFWVIDTLTQVYVHTGDARMRYYLRGILQRWPALYRPEYEDKITEYGPGSMTEGLGLFDGAGPGRGGRYNYGNADSLPLNEPVGNSKLRIVAGANAAIAFCKDGTHSDLADYQTDGKGACSFRIVSTLKDEFDVSFSYPYVDISQLPVYLQRNGQLQALTAAAVRHPPQALSSLYLSRLRNGDTIFIGAANLARHPINITIPLTYKDNDDVSKYSGVSSDFDIIPLSSTSSRKLSQDWNDLASFAGLAQGLHWTYGVPYFQKSYTGGITTKISGARAIFLFYAPKSIDVVGAPPHLVLDNGQTIRLSGQAAPAWRGWPPSFQRVVLMDYALIPSGHTVQQVVATAGNQLMGVTAFRGRMTDLQTTLHAM
ncbi:MAG: hypothetical protein JOZ57_04220, partial [Abitibacteriaceae bacterium]|nr:hypothetical protein [Abditibacteriaceae bacterium]